MSSVPAGRGAGATLPFFALCFAATWACFITVAVAVPARSPAGAALVLLGAYAPSLVALTLAGRSGGWPAVRELIAPVFRWRVAAGWYGFAAAFMLVIRLIAAVIYRVWLGEWPGPIGADAYLIPLAIAFSAPFQAGEEIGWRGFALPRLATRLGLPVASLALGVIWALWHLPQFYIRDGDSYQQSFPIFLLQVTALSVAMTWLWARTRRSLLLMMLFHSGVNNSRDIVATAMPEGPGVFSWHGTPMAWLSVGLLWACAIGFLADLARRKETRRAPLDDSAAAAGAAP